MRLPPAPVFVLLTLSLLAPAAVTAGAADATPASRGAARGVKHVSVPVAGRAVDTSHPDHVIGHGTASSCKGRAVRRAVARGGVITFRCGPDPVVIRMRRTAKVDNNSHRVVIDGGGLVTLSGLGRHRILYQDTCDGRQHWTTSHCTDQRFPHLVIQHLGLRDGNSTGALYAGGGGGAVFAFGGRLKIVDAHFTDNRCDRTGPDLGGAAVRSRNQYHGKPVYVVNSTFRGGRCSNGSALSGLNVSWTVLNSRFIGNRAIGHGANPARPGTPGGGSGGAIYCDGDRYALRIGGTLIRHNHANEGGGAIFFVSNDRTGTLHLHWSTLRHNPDTFETRPGIFYLGRWPIDLSHSVIR